MQDLQQTIELILDYIRGIWIRKRYVIIASWLICPIGFVKVASLPDVYSSNAQVFVDTRSMLEPMLAGISLYEDPEREVRLMAQTLKSRSNIEEIAREADLDITVTTDNQYDTLITQLTNDIRFSRTGRNNIYSISYSSQDPQLAKTVVQETLDLFVEGSLGGNRKDSESANRFLEEQIAEFEARLSEAEQQRANFRRRHVDILPLQGSFHNNLAGLQEQLGNTRLLIKEASQKANTLKGRLTGNRKASDGFSVQNNDSAPVITTRFDSRIKSLEEKLDSLMLRFTEKHPDVMETQSLLDSLLASRQKEIDVFLNQDENEGSPILSQLNQEITLEISRLEGEIASLKVREDNYVGKINELRNKIDLVPQIEAEGISLNRNYDIIKDKYEDLLTRKEAADLSRRANLSSDDLQFRIITPPLIPQSPAGPNRFINYTLVLIAGFGVGIGIAFLISQLTPVLVRGQQLSAITGYPILGVVTHLDIDKIKRTERFRLIVFVVSSSAILFMYGVLVAADVMNIDLLGKVMS